MPYFYLERKKKCLTQEGIDKLIELYYEGLNYVEIGKNLGVGEEVMTRWAKELNLKDRRRKYHFNEEYFKEIDTPEKAYWLGFLSADGYVHESRGYVALELQESDKAHVEKFQKALELTDKPLLTIQTNGFTHYRSVVYSKKMISDLVKWNVHQKKSLDFKPPAIDKNLVSYWIIGYMDGDGCVFEAKGRIKISFTGTEATMQFIKNFFNSSNKISLEHRCENTFKFTLEVDLSEQFLRNYNYSKLDFALDRKKAKYAPSIE